MAGKVEKSLSYFLRSIDGEEWELWTFSDEKRPQFVRRLLDPAEVPGNTVVALPARQTVTFPSWVATTDRNVIPEILQLQLEKRGLLSKNGSGCLMDYRVVETRDSRALTVATVLQADFPPELTFERATRFEPSVYTLALPQDRLVIWRERGRLSVAATRGREPLVAQVLGDRELSERAVIELKCILLQLQLQDFCGALLGVHLIGEFGTDDADRLQKLLGLKVTRESVPPPSLPTIRSRLLPAEVSVLHLKRRRRGRIWFAIWALATLYLLGLTAFAGYLYWEKRLANSLRRQIQGQTPTVAAIQKTAEQWRQVEAAVNPQIYPVELLYQVASLLPPDGMRLTGFEIEKGKVTIRGEASTAPAAFKFSEELKAKPELQMFNWQMPSPTLRPDGRAEFAIEGEPKFAKTN
jgi:Fimbrial assembly protein (PilN)